MRFLTPIPQVNYSIYFVSLLNPFLSESYAGVAALPAADSYSTVLKLAVLVNLKPFS
jgi:hypothetical protein